MDCKNFHIDLEYPLFKDKLKLSERNHLHLQTKDKRYVIKIIVKEFDENLSFCANYHYKMDKDKHIYIFVENGLMLHTCYDEEKDRLKIAPYGYFDKIIKLIH